MKLAAVRFERNVELEDADLQAAVGLPTSFRAFRSPWATPELLSAVEDRVKAAYRARGFSDVSVRRPSEERDGHDLTLVFEVREGAQRFLSSLVLELPDEKDLPAWDLAEALPFLVSDHPMVEPGATDHVRQYRVDRPTLKEGLATLESIASSERPGIRVFRLRAAQPIPLVKSDLANVLTMLRQKLVDWGVGKPAPEQLRVEEEGAGVVVTLTVQSQPRNEVSRLIVQGADVTRARAILREAELEPGQGLGPDRLSKAQGAVAGLGAFERVDLFSARELEPEGTADASSWREGDLLLRLRERSPWIFTSSFGYDQSQGYHFGFGAQRLNLGGMGRVMDFGLRAGDSTLRNPSLRKWFPTGPYTRSVDSYSVAYTDPHLRLLNLDQIQFRTEAAYIEEQRSIYRLRRRRFLNSLEHRLGAEILFQVGYRFERSEVEPAVDVNIRKEDLAVVSRFPGRAILSAPFVQLLRDRRNNPLDPTEGSFSVFRLEFANQFFGTSPNSSFVKAELRHQWNWPIGRNASAGVVTLGLRLGAARPTASTSQELPLAERFFAGGPGTHRGVQPDALGRQGKVPLFGPDGKPILDELGQQKVESVPLGGQGLVLANLEYRFPISFFGSAVWGELFSDSGQVYQNLQRTSDAAPGTATHPPMRTSLGVGLILKVGLPLKVEFAWDVRRILGRSRTADEEDTRLKSLLISAGFQF